MAVLGVVLGSFTVLLPVETSSRYAWISLVVDAATILLVWLAVAVSTRLTRPWLTRAAGPDSLRTP
jgi:hypothetical protein